LKPEQPLNFDLSDHLIDQFIEKIKPLARPQAEAAINRALETMLKNPASGPHKQANGAWYYRYKEEGLAFTLVIRYPTDLSRVRPVVVTVLTLPEGETSGKRFKPGFELRNFINEIQRELKDLETENKALKQGLRAGDQPDSLDRLNDELIALKAEVRELKIANLRSKAEIDDLTGKYEERILRMKSQIEMLNGHIVEAKEKHARDAAQWQEWFNTANSKPARPTVKIQELDRAVQTLSRRYDAIKKHCENLTLFANKNATSARQLSTELYRVLKLIEEHPFTSAIKIHAMLEDVMESYKPGYKARRDKMIIDQNNGLDPFIPKE
jgi:hypothetical protein